MVRQVRNGKDLPPIHPEATKRQIDVLTWLAEGKRAKEICSLLNCTPYAVRQRIRRLQQKFKARSTPALIAIAIRNGIIS